MDDSKKDSDKHACQAFTQTKSGCKRLSAKKDFWLQLFFADSSAGYIESDISSDCNVWLQTLGLDATCALISAPLPKPGTEAVPEADWRKSPSKRQGTQAVKNYLWAHTSVISFLSVVLQGLHKSRIHSIDVWWVCVCVSRRQREKEDRNLQRIDSRLSL